MRLKTFFLSPSPVYLGGLLVAVGLLLNAFPWIFEYVAHGTTNHNAPAPIGFILLSVGFFTVKGHCSANEYSPGVAMFGMLGLLCFLQALACML